MTTHVSTRDIFQFSCHYWAKSWLKLSIFAGLIVCNTVLMNAAFPTYIRELINAVTTYSQHMSAGWPIVWYYFTLIFLVFFIATMIWGIAFILWVNTAAHILHNIINDALFKVQRFSADWHANTFAGGTVRKITRGMWSFDRFEDVIFVNLFVIALAVGITIATLAVHVPYAALYMLFFVVLYTVISLVVSKHIMMPRYRNAAARDTAVGATLADIMTGMPTVKSFAGEGREDTLFQRVSDDWLYTSLNTWQTARYIDTFRSILRILLFSGMLLLAIHEWHYGRASAGDVALVVTCYLNISGFLRDLGTMINDLQRAMSEMEDIVSFWKQDIEVQNKPGALNMAITKQNGEIVFDRVGFTYKNTLAPIYDDLSITIKAGEKIALVGMSGSGKSTFVKLLQRLYDLNTGEIRINGQNIANVTQESLRSAIALVPQDPILFHRSLAENIAYARPNATQAEIEQAARQAFAHDFITRFPSGYETLVGERGVKLSGGERQRVALARAILADAPILVLDEATSSLDSVSEHYIQKALETLMQGRTTITIAHRLATIRAVDRILVFEDGKIVEQGTHDTLLANPGSLYKRLYDMQALELH